MATVGELPWQAQGGVRFGDDARQDLESISRRIRTFAESGLERRQREDIMSELIGADKRVFLGFAFYQQYMEVLITREGRRSLQVFGTAFETSKSDMEVISAKVRAAFTLGNYDPICLENLKCVEFFDAYSRSLITI